MTEQPAWNEADSQLYLQLADLAVPDRERQNAIIIELVTEAVARSRADRARIAELCCGGGDLAELILTNVATADYLGYDGSAQMLETTGNRLAPFTDRVTLREFDLAASDWRTNFNATAYVTSLAVHHLDGRQKAQLFADIHDRLNSGGVFVLADLVEPAASIGRRIAAREYDDVVKQRSKRISGDLSGFDRFSDAQWNYFRHGDDRGIDVPSTLADQLTWLHEAGFIDVDVHWMAAGHALMSGWRA